ncbi:hypothetical protein Tco_0476028 [Tanacetum coccineum]
MDESQSYLTAVEHRECYDGLIKYYELDKSLLFTYDKVYSLKRSRKDKDKDEALPLDQTEGTKSQSKSSGKSVHAEEPEFKTPQQGPTQSWLMTLASSADKPSKTFDELMSTPIDFSVYIMNELNITNLTQETLLGPAFKLLKGTRTNFAELEYDFEECYKALSEKLDWDNPEGGDYSFDLTKPPPPLSHEWESSLSMNLQVIEEIASKHMESLKFAYVKNVHYEVSAETCMVSDKDLKYERAITIIYTFKEGDFLRLRINDIEDILNLIVQNRLTNLSDDDVSDFAIALRCFTRKHVIPKESQNLQLGVKVLPEEDQRHRAIDYQIRHQKTGPITLHNQDPQRTHLC